MQYIRPIACFAVPVLTQIPKSKTNEEAVTGLLQLAHDCHAAYGQAAEKAKDAELKQALTKFASQADTQADQWRGEVCFWRFASMTIAYALASNDALSHMTKAMHLHRKKSLWKRPYPVHLLWWAFACMVSVLFRT